MSSTNPLPNLAGLSLQVPKNQNTDDLYIMVVINVRKQVFRVRKAFVLADSGFFREAFTGQSPTAKSLEITVNNVSPRIFGLIVEWLETDSLAENDGRTRSCRDLVELWLLADRFIMPRLQNQTMDELEMARRMGRPFSSALLKRIYEKTNESSPLRSYLVDMCVEGTRGGLRASDPPQFLVDVINGMRALTEGHKKKQGRAGKPWRPSVQRMKIYYVRKKPSPLTAAPQALNTRV